MAKKEEKSKVVLERMYNVPLRKEYMKAPRWKRTKKAGIALREFIEKHMKSDKVLISKFANEFLWKHGIKNPPHHVKVNASKDDKGVVRVELVELTASNKREQEKVKSLRKSKEDKDKQKKDAAKKEKETAKKGPTEAKEEALESKVEDIKHTQEEKAKEVLKEEIKELKKEGQKEKPQNIPPKQHFQEQHPTGPQHQ